MTEGGKQTRREYRIPNKEYRIMKEVGGQGTESGRAKLLGAREWIRELVD